MGIKTLCVISCSKNKIWNKYPHIGPVPSKYVYTGEFHKKCQTYAKLVYPTEWIILSAKYGFLKPDDIIPETYNITFDDENSIQNDDLKTQIKAKKLDRYDQIVILGSKLYKEKIENLFSCDIVSPLIGIRNGIMKQRIINMIKEEIRGGLNEWE